MSAIDGSHLHVVLDGVFEAPDDVSQVSASPGVVADAPVGVHRLVLAGLDVAHVVGGDCRAARVRRLGPGHAQGRVAAGDVCDGRRRWSANVGFASRNLGPGADSIRVAGPQLYLVVDLAVEARDGVAPIAGRSDVGLFGPVRVALVGRILSNVAQVVGRYGALACVDRLLPFDFQGAPAWSYRVQIWSARNVSVAVDGDAPRLEGPSICGRGVLNLQRPLAGGIFAQVPGRTKAEIGGQRPSF